MNMFWRLFLAISTLIALTTGSIAQEADDP